MRSSVSFALLYWQRAESRLSLESASFETPQKKTWCTVASSIIMYVGKSERPDSVLACLADDQALPMVERPGTSVLRAPSTYSSTAVLQF
jgi:hypothetical protein